MNQPIRILVWHGSRGEGARLTEIYHEVSRALAGAGGNVSKAAEALGLSRQALYRKMEKHGLTVERRLRG